MSLKKHFSNLSKDCFRSICGLISTPLWKILDPLRGSASILCYHRVVPYHKAQLTHTANLAVEPDIFEQHLEYLSSRHNIISMDTLVAGLRGEEKLPVDAAVLTFDDGYLDFKDYAWPLLKKYRLPGIVYICTGFLEGHGRLWWHELDEIVQSGKPVSFSWGGKAYHIEKSSQVNSSATYRQLRSLFIDTDVSRHDDLFRILKKSVGVEPEITATIKMMNWADIKQLDNDPLITIGAHTHTHSVLTLLDREAARKDIVKNKLLLEETLGHPVLHFAYPFGTHIECGEREFRIVQACGFSDAVTLMKGHIFPGKVDMFAIPRLHIPRKTLSVNRLTGMLSGLEVLANRFRLLRA